MNPPRKLSQDQIAASWANRRARISKLVSTGGNWMPVIIFATLLMTDEARINAWGFQIYAYRIALLFTFPFVVARMATEPPRLTIADFMIMLAGAWIFISTWMNYNIVVASKSGLSQTLDLVAPYLVGRLLIRTPLDLRRFLYRITPLIVATGLLLFVESASHEYLLRPLVGSITGLSPDAALARMYEVRNGFLRATGPFLHPIAAGLFMGTLVPLYIAADLPKRRWFGLLGSLGGVFSLSSAAMLSMGAGIALSIYGSVQRSLRWGWAPVIAGAGIIGFFIQMLTESGLIKFIIRYASLNPQTGYYRLLIWEYGWADVGRHPWFGIGLFNAFDRPRWMISDSVDNYWLLVALRFGFPCMAMLLITVVFNVIILGRATLAREPEALKGRPMAVGVVISLVIAYMLLLTSAPWNADIVWFTMLVGIAGGLARPIVIAAPQPVARERRPGRLPAAALG